MQPRSLLILAAGLGTRFGGLKQLAPVTPAGETLLDFTLYDALAAGVNEVVFIVRQSIEQAILERFSACLAGRARLLCVRQEEGWLPPELPTRDQPWGTGQALLSARHAVSGDFWVLNADDFYGRQTYLQMAAVPTGTWSLAGFRLADTLPAAGGFSRARCELDDESWLRGITECRNVRREGERILWQGREFPAAMPVSMNFWGFDAAVFPCLEEGLREFAANGNHAGGAEFTLPDAIGRCIRQGGARVKLIPAVGPWLGLTHPGDRALVSARLGELREAGAYPPRLW